MEEKQIRWGDIYYVPFNELSNIRKPFLKGENADDHSQKGSRPAIVVSNDHGNNNSPMVLVVPLTTKKKPDLPTHTTIQSSRQESTALCEQLTKCPKKYLQSYVGHLTIDETTRIERCLKLAISSDIKNDLHKAESTKPLTAEQNPNPSQDLLAMQLKLERLRAERDTYKQLHSEHIQALQKKAWKEF